MTRLPRTQARHWLGAALAAVTLATTAPAQSSAPDPRPTVAVLYFTNSALVRHDEYEPLTKGISEMLITELAANPAIRVIERDQIEHLLKEQNLGASDRVDKETAVKLGKVLGVHHMLMGGFVIDPRETMRIDLRSVNVETSQIEHVETVTGKAEEVLKLIADLGAKTNKGLNLPPMPARASRPSVGQASWRAAQLFSRALVERDKGNIDGAVALYKASLEADPKFERARVLLASIEKPPSGTQ